MSTNENADNAIIFDPHAPQSQSEYQSLNSDPNHHTAPQPTHPKNNNITCAIFVAVILFFLVVIMYLFYLLDHIHEDETRPLYVLFNATIYASPALGISATSLHHEQLHNRRERVKLGLLPYSLASVLVVGNDGRIYDVGNEVLLNSTNYKKLPHVDLNGAVLTPGFSDAHGHMINYGLSFSEPDLRTAKTPTEFVQQLLSFCKENNIDINHDPGYWIIGGRWDESKWEDDSDFDYHHNPDGSNPMPWHEILDRDFTHIGVALKRIDGHACFVNQFVIDRLDLPEDDPPGGQILRDKDGKPTGVLIDYACELVWAHVEAQPTRMHKLQAIVKSQQQLLRLGITNVHDASVIDAELFASQVARKASSSEEFVKGVGTQDTLYDPFPLRVYGMLDVEGVCAPNNYTCPDPFPFQQISYNTIPTYKNGTAWAHSIVFPTVSRTSFPALNFLPKIKSAVNGKFSMSAAKLMSDGALGSWGAFMLEPYADKDTKGIQMYSVEQLKFVVEKLARQNFQVCTHAIGDAAVSQVVNTYHDVSEITKRSAFIAKRHRIEHFQIIPKNLPEWSSLLNRLQILPSMQPIHAVQDRSFAEKRLGAERLENQSYLWRQIEGLLDILPLGTDFPVSMPSVIDNLYAAVTMKENTFDLPPFLPNHTLHIIDALMGITYDAAYASHREHDLGSIYPGKIADFVLIDKDLINMKNGGPDSKTDDSDYVGNLLNHTTIMATFVDGNIVYEHQGVKVTKYKNQKGQTIHSFHAPESIQTQNGDKKAPWFANKLYNTASKLSPEETRQTALNLREKLHNELLSYTFPLNHNQCFDNHQLLEVLANIATIFNPQQKYDLQTVTDGKEQVLPDDLRFWSDLRYIVSSQRISHIHKYFLAPQNSVECKVLSGDALNNCIAAKRQHYLNNYQYTHLTYGDSTVKHFHSHGHETLPNHTKYRSNLVFPVNCNDQNCADSSQIRVIQPRVPPCIDHSCNREYARRVNFLHDPTRLYQRVDDRSQLFYDDHRDVISKTPQDSAKFIVMN